MYIFLSETTSTNQYALENSRLFGGRPYSVVYTQRQTAGRGQAGNSWEAEPDKNVCFSIVCHPRFIKPAEQFLLSMTIAVAVVSQLREDFPAEAEHFRTKWPNDIYWKDRKLGGILIENTLQGARIADCILGVGLNINQRTFLSDAPNPISLITITGSETDGPELMHRIAERFSRMVDELQTTALMQSSELGFSVLADRIRDDYHRLLYLYDNGFHQFEDSRGSFSAKIIKVRNDGRLLLQTSTGEDRAYWLKEVRFL